MALLWMWTASMQGLAQQDPADTATNNFQPSSQIEERASEGSPPDASLPSENDHVPPATSPIDPSDAANESLFANEHIARIAGPSVVRLSVQPMDAPVRYASGVCVGPREIVTALEPLLNSVRGQVDLGGDPRPFPIARIVAIDEKRNLALVRVGGDSFGIRPIAFADPSPNQGGPLWRVSFPQGHATSRPAIVESYVLPPTPDGTVLIEHPYDAASAGGALTNERGHLVGVVLPGQGPNAVTQVAPIEDVRRLMRQNRVSISVADLGRFLEQEEKRLTSHADSDELYRLDEDTLDASNRDKTRRAGRDDDVERRHDKSSKLSLPCVLAGVVFGPPVAVLTGSCAALFGVCSIYGCAGSVLVLTSLARLGVITAAVTGGLTLVAGVFSTAAFLLAMTSSRPYGLSSRDTLLLAGSTGIATLAAGSIAAGALALSWYAFQQEGTRKPGTAEQPPVSNGGEI